MSLSCSLFVLYSPRNDPDPEMIPFQELIEDHFGVDAKRNGDHFGVDLGTISGLGIISGAVQFPKWGPLMLF